MLTAVPSTPAPQGILREVIDGLDPRLVYVLRDVLLERKRQDTLFGRIGHPPLRWLAILAKWIGKLGAAALTGEPEEMRKRAVQVMAIGLAMVELGFDGPDVDESQPAPGVEFEEDDELWDDIGGEG